MGVGYRVRSRCIADGLELLTSSGVLLVQILILVSVLDVLGLLLWVIYTAGIEYRDSSRINSKRV